MSYSFILIRSAQQYQRATYQAHHDTGFCQPTVTSVSNNHSRVATLLLLWPSSLPYHCNLCGGHGSVVATGWTVRGSNPVAEEIFRTRPDRSWGSPFLLHSGYLVSFLGVKWPVSCVYHRLPSNAEVKERVMYLRLWASVVCYRMAFTLAIIGRHEKEKKSRNEIGAEGDTWWRKTRKKRK